MRYQIPPCAKEHMVGREKESARGSSDPHAGRGIPRGSGVPP
jgi:hypothetical protein